ncbi:hypothetical protein RND81_10G022100 [Saponaria officinalis]|uniref:Gnk2-homologous domain-containing protein n=1 Tax=Saponaria officinalis TaxID=3572 RepID=A0AAW1HX91_SAPOF
MKMNKKKVIIIIVLQITILSLGKIVSAQEQVEYAGYYCEKVNITTTYVDNINTLLGIFTNQSSDDSMFFNTSSGVGDDQVHGLYLCRPDISPETCDICIRRSVRVIKTYCPISLEALIWFHECMVHYSNRIVAATLQTEPRDSHYSDYSVSQPDIFPEIRNETLERIITDASMPENEDRFAYDSSEFTPFEGFYGMAWCTPDIKPSQCESCLRTAVSKIPDCCYNGLALWAYILQPSCVLRSCTN